MIRYLWIPALLLALALLLLFLRKLWKAAHPDSTKAKEDLMQHIRHFAGLYNPLFQAVESQNSRRAEKYLNIWEKQANDLENLRLFLKALRRQADDPLVCADALLTMLEIWGIDHDSAGYIIPVTKEQEALYLFDDVYQMGDQARIVRPAWYLVTEDRLICIETGTAEII